jgi:pantetheine-phosphate adenylyltransferase
MNRHLNPRIETVFMMPKEEYSYVSSRLLKEVSRYGAEITGLLPPSVYERMRVKQGNGPRASDPRGRGPEEAL